MLKWLHEVVGLQCSGRIELHRSKFEGLGHNQKSCHEEQRNIGRPAKVSVSYKSIRARPPANRRQTYNLNQINPASNSPLGGGHHFAHKYLAQCDCQRVAEEHDQLKEIRTIDLVRFRVPAKYYQRNGGKSNRKLQKLPHCERVIEHQKGQDHRHERRKVLHHDHRRCLEALQSLVANKQRKCHLCGSYRQRHNVLPIYLVEHFRLQVPIEVDNSQDKRNDRAVPKQLEYSKTRVSFVAKRSKRLCETTNYIGEHEVEDAPGVTLLLLVLRTLHKIGTNLLHFKYLINRL